MINPKADPDRLFTTDEVAEYFCVHVRTIYRWIEEGRLDAVKVGHRYLISANVIQDRIQRSKVIIY